MYKTVQINCFTKVLYVTAYPCVSTSVPLTCVWAFGFVGCILFTTLCITRMQFELHKRDPPPTSCQISGNYWQMYHVHPYSMYVFLQLIPDGNPARVGREENTNEHPLKKEAQKYPQQPETKTVAKLSMSEVCLLPRPSYSRGRACKAQSQHQHFMKKRFSESVCNTVEAEGPIFPKLVRRVFLKELLSTSLFTSST